MAARHLRHYGYHPTVYYPKRPKNELYLVGYEDCLLVCMSAAVGGGASSRVHTGVARGGLLVLVSKTSIALLCFLRCPRLLALFFWQAANSMRV